MSWYIIEGADDTGKTTLARELESGGWNYQHAGPEDTLPILARRMADLQFVEYVVWDRAHLGEVVHGPLDRNLTPSIGWQRLIEAFLLEKKARCALLRIRRGPLAEWENSPRRQHDLVMAFDRAASQSVLRWGEWPDPMPRRLDHWTRDRDYLNRVDGEGLGGGEQPWVWVLGEQESRATPVPWPFATRCGIELVWPAIDPRHVRVSNCLQALPKQKLEPAYLNERWNRLGRPPVVALGSSVERWCGISEVEVTVKLPHPQWHLRFRSSQPHEYLRDLARAIQTGMKLRMNRLTGAEAQSQGG